MPLPNLTFIKGQGGLGRPLESRDHVSGMVFYCANGDLPSGFTTTAREKRVFSVEGAEDLGIAGNYGDATQAFATYLVTNAGADGDVIKIEVDDIDPNTGEPRTITLCELTRTAAMSTATLLGAYIVQAIKNGNQVHGYWAQTTNPAEVTIKAPHSMGTLLNTGTPYAVTITGTIAGTLTQNTQAGVASLQKPWHYQISEFFRQQPKGELWLGFYAVPATYDFEEVATLQNAAAGEIRQVGVYKQEAWDIADVTALNTVAAALDDAKQPLSAVLTADFSGETDMTALGTLATMTNNKVSVVITQDGSRIGYVNWLTSEISVPNLGAALGTIAKAKVSESIGWVGQFNISNGSECEVIIYANGDPLGNNNELEALNSERYLFLKKHVGLSGSYWNDSHTAITPTSDYAYIENNRTIDKAIRNLNAAYLPSLNSPIKFNSDGTITDIDVARLESIGNVALDQMVKDDELSAKSVTINPVQNVLQTSTLTIAVTLVINGVARFIEIPIGFKPSLA